MHTDQKLSPYAKFLLLALIVMTIVFAVIYPMTLSRKGFLYRDHVLVPATENSTTTYSASVKGETWRFTVTADNTVTFRCGEKEYGPFTVKEDSSAIPKENGMASQMTGVEVREGETILFRGGVCRVQGILMLVDETNTSADITVSVGNNPPVDPMRPSVTTILKLVQGPKLTHKGHGAYWFFGAFLSLTVGLFILFPDEWFRLRFLFRVRDPDMVEPSEWELSMRPVSWTIAALAVLFLYCTGLK